MWNPKFLSISARWFGNLPSWGVTAILVALIGIASLWYLSPSAIEFPMDDAYIHMVYARNLVETGAIFFNDPSERGIATTSILLVLLLAAGYKLGIALELLVKCLGIASLVTVSAGLYQLLRPFWHPLVSFSGSLLVGLSGNMIWFSLSGMETTLFLALGVLALLAYQQERWCWLGITLGLLALTRPEGLALALAIGVIEILVHKGIRRGILISGVICLGLCGPWYGYLLWRTGNILPTSGIIKHFSRTLTLQIALQKNSALAFLGRIPSLLYIAMWVVYLLVFTLGGMSLPAPMISLGELGGAIPVSLSVWSIPAWGLVILLLVIAFRRFHPIQKIREHLQDTAKRPMVILLLWVILHNICYMVFLPVPGTASRYGAVNHILLWLVLLYGLVGLAGRRWLTTIMTAGLIIIAAANTAYWNSVYDANLDHMQKVRIAAAHFIRDNIPEEDVFGAMDIGAIRYHGERTIVDLGGLIDPDAYRWFLSDTADQYILNFAVDYLALPGRMGASDEGWIDIAEIMGLNTSHLFSMDPVAVFKIDRERWLQGYLPTTNYQASVVIYRLQPANR